MSDCKGFPLRLRPEVYRALRKWADDELRSVNAEIEYLLVRALREAGRFPREPEHHDDQEDLDRPR